MYPDTRGRISTNSTASSRPVNSSHSFTSFSIAVTTLTGSGGCCVTDAFLHPLPAKKTSKRLTLAKKKRFIHLPPRPPSARKTYGGIHRPPSRKGNYQK